MSLSLNEVYSVAATSESDVYIVSCNVTESDGDYDVEYCSRPEDTDGLNPQIREWLTQNPGFPIATYTPPPPPSLEEIRANMPSLTARQLRLGLVGHGYSMSQVSAVIDAMPEGADKETARIEWEYATTFERVHPLIGTVGAALAISETQIDTMWNASVNL